jgi:hypothetical protein
MVKKWALIAPLACAVLGCGGSAAGDQDDDGRADREAAPPSNPVFTLYDELRTAVAGTPDLVEDAHRLYELPPARIERDGQLVQERIGDESARSRSLVTYGVGLVQTIEVARCHDVASACADGETLAVVGNFVNHNGSTKLTAVVQEALLRLHVPPESPLFDARDYFEHGFTARPGWVGRTGAEYRLLDNDGQIVQRLAYPGQQPTLTTYVPELIQSIRAGGSNILQVGSTATLR